VIDEVSRGDPAWARGRRRVAEDFERIEFDPAAADELADHLVLGGSLPIAARDDALHVAAATLGGADYLTTWNLKHLANRTIRRRVEKLVRSAGLEPVTIVTPDELLESMP
jgi:hypothetical protein